MKITTSLLSAFILLSLLSCREKKDTDAISTDLVNNPLSADPKTEEAVKNLPVLTFKEPAFDFGTIRQGDKVTHEYTFTNTGHSDLIISNATGSCGCTVPEYPKQPIAPGKEGVIHVVFSSEGKSGKVEKTITVLANTIPNDAVLIISGEITVPAEKK